MELVERITAQKYLGGVIVLRGAGNSETEFGIVKELCEELVAQAKAEGTLPPLIVCLPENGSLEALDEDEMRAAGWVRADG